MTATGMTDQLILDRHDGRPTLVVYVLDGEPHLQWLLLGYTESIDLWLDMKLTWIEADELIEQVPAMLDDYVATKPGRSIDLSLRVPTAGWVISGTTEVPETNFRVKAMIDWMVGYTREFLVTLDISTSVDEVNQMHHAQHELELINA